jgi:hypothetical protein
MARVHREFQCLMAAAVLLGTAGYAQAPPNQIPAGDLVRAVIANELKPQANATRWMYQLEKEEAGTVQTKEIVETKDGSLEKLIAASGRSLTPQQQRQEAERVVKLARDPEQQHKLQQARKKDEEQCRNFMQMIPDAFTFSYAGQDGDLVKVTFAPNPEFQPPSREGRVLHELEGEMWLHRSQERLVNISGHLVNEVKFGGGLLGHLEKGGQFVVKRDEVAAGDWEMTAMEVDMRGKILLFKNITVRQKERHSNFRQVSDGLTLSEAADLLTRHTLVAAYPTGGDTAENKSSR